MSKLINLTGSRFGSYTVLKRSDRESHMPYWVCQCDCGTVRDVLGTSLRGGQSRSCGCKMREHGGGRQIKYGTKAIEMDEYNIWRGMKARCTNPENYSNRNYAARGIRVCKRWLDSYEAFREDMGPRPSKRHSVERKNNDLHYSCGKCDECLQENWPANCKWATNREQSRNTRTNRLITFQGKTATIREWAEITGINEGTLKSRIDRDGWSVERALTERPAMPDERKQMRLST